MQTDSHPADTSSSTARCTPRFPRAVRALTRSAALGITLASVMVHEASAADAPATSPPKLGIVHGVVVDGKEPAVGVTVALIGSPKGANTDENGAFRIVGVTPGAYRIRLSRVDRTPRMFVVTVTPGENAALRLQLGAELVVPVPVIEVFADGMTDVKRSDSAIQFDREKINRIRVDTIVEVVALAPGMVAAEDGLHSRGGRRTEVKTLIGGIPVAEPLFGGAPEVSKIGVEAVEVITGGISAEYGDALSGIVNLTTREGGKKFAGDVQWHTDRYGENTKTYNNFDRLSLGFGGPTPLKGLTWFAAWEGTFTDTYLDASMSQTREVLVDFLRIGNRQSNQVNMNGKLAWKSDAGRKITFEMLRNRGLDTPYNHMWSRKGYVSVLQDTVESPGGGFDLVPRYGRWSFFQEDSTFVYQNLADHVPTTEERFAQEMLVWLEPFGKNDVATLRLSRFRFDTHTSVQGQEPWEYDIRQPLYWAGNVENDPYFATHGDFPAWGDQSTTTWTMNGDWTTRRFESHLLKAGGQVVYNAMHLVNLQFPNDESQGLPGLVRSDYENYNPEASIFVQDRWEYEGLVLNAGLRYDMFTPGAQITDEDLPQGRIKRQVSPRLGVAYPITKDDALSFFYGWTYQTPPRDHLYENRNVNATVAIRGNPDLEPETVISYQAAVQHRFTRDVAGQFAVFYKDIFGLIATRQQVDPLSGLLVPVFVNQDYASARGFEMSLTKRFSHKFSADVNYTYQIASGVASNPNDGLQFANGNQLYLPIAEQALNWDQRHTLNANLVMRDPGRWGLTVLWTFGSGLPYTPTFRNDRRPDPTFKNSRRLPSRSELSIAADKFFRIWSRNVTFFVDARNVLDSRAIRDLTPGNFPNPFINQVGPDDYDVYYTETGRAGGAYLKDTNGDREDDWVALNDPRVFAEGRNVRIGAGISF